RGAGEDGLCCRDADVCGGGPRAARRCAVDQRQDAAVACFSAGCVSRVRKGWEPVSEAYDSVKYSHENDSHLSQSIRSSGHEAYLCESLDIFAVCLSGLRGGGQQVSHCQDSSECGK